MKNLNFAGRITQFFLSNTPLTVLVLLTTILAGVGTYLLTPKQYNPTITLPAFSVELEYPGATAEEVEKFVTREMEEKIADIVGVDKIYSRSIDGGKALINVQFHIGEDLESSKVKMTQKIQENLDRLAFAMKRPIIKNLDPESVPILTLGFSSSALTQNEIRPLVKEILEELRKVPDVANLNLHGGERQVLQIHLDPDRLQAYQISPLQIADVLKSSNIRTLAGSLKDGQTVHQIEVGGRLIEEEEIQNLPLSENINLGDVADVFKGYREKTSFVEVSSAEKDTPQDVVFLSLAKRKGSNAILVVEKVQESLEKVLEQDRYQNLDLKIYKNEGDVAQKAIQNLLQSLVLSVGIVSLVLILFLGFRSAMIVAVAIPLTIGLVFVMGYLFGESINRITLFALILSLGLLVDNATVIVENIFRHTQKKKPKKQAIIEAVNEVGLGLFISTLTSVVVFLPTSQISGMMGEYMGPLSFFVPMALVLSLVIAYILTPFLADLFLPDVPKPVSEKKSFFDTLSEKYEKSLTSLLETPWKKKFFLGLVFVAFISVFTFPLFQLVHFRMLPTADKEQFFVSLDAPEGTDIEKTREITQKIIPLFLSHQDVDFVQNFVGEPPVIDFNGFFKGAYMRTSPHLATLRVGLTPPEKRKTPSSEIVYELREKTYQMIAQKDDPVMIKTVVKFLEDPPGPPVRSTLEIKIQGPDREKLETVARDLNKKVIQTKGVYDTDTSIEAPSEKTVLEVDHEKALRSNVSAQEINQTLQMVLSALPVGQYHHPQVREISHIEMQFRPSSQKNIQDLSRIHIKNKNQEMISLSSLVKEKQVRPHPTLYLDEREPTVYVSAEMGDRSVVYAVIDLLPQILNYDFPQGGKLTSWDLFGFTFETPEKETYHVQWGGEFEMTLENFRDLGLAMIVAFLLIYMILVAQFQSFKIPLLIMTTMPLGFIGIMPGFALLDAGWGTFLTATSLIGFIALMGIVVNNAIIYLEYFQVLLQQGLSQHQALIKAGKTRLRPILLTSLTTILGNLTIASDPVWSGLAWAIVFGLSLSAFLTLGVFPLLYEMTHKE